MTDGVNTSDLIAHAAEHGCTASPHQLKRLRQEGLLQRPSQVHVPGQPGSATRYPQAALDQLVGVLQLRSSGYRNFRDLRIASWLDGLEVDFKLLQPEVVSKLGLEVANYQGLSASTPDEDLLRRLSTIEDQPTTRRAAQFRRSVSPVALSDALLTILQIALDTDYAGVASETFDSVFALDSEEQETVSESYQGWNMPSVTQWPRIISRTGRKWFPTGPTWVDFVRSIFNHPDVLSEFSPSPGTTFALSHVRGRILASTQDTLQARNFIACQGIVLARHNPDRLLALFGSDDN